MILLVLGLVVGLVLAITGAGGSIIAVPLLMFGMGWTILQAAPVGLLAVASSAAIGTLMGLRAGIVRYRAAGLMAAAGVATAPLGLFTAHHIPSQPLTLGFAALLMWISWRMFRQARADLAGGPGLQGGQSTSPCLIDPATGRFRWTDRCGRSLAAAGLGAGFLSGLLGVGGGFLIVPALRRVTNLPTNAIVATSMMVMALVSTGSVVSAAVAGHLPGTAALPFAGGAIAGMLSGRLIADRIAGPRLQQGFALLAAGVSILLMAKLVIEHF